MRVRERGGFNCGKKITMDSDNRRLYFPRPKNRPAPGRFLWRSSLDLDGEEEPSVLIWMDNTMISGGYLSLVLIDPRFMLWSGSFDHDYNRQSRLSNARWRSTVGVSGGWVGGWEARMVTGGHLSFVQRTAQH